MISLLIFFILRYEELYLLSKSRSLLTYLYTLDSGEYKYKSGAIYNENKVFDTNYYFDGIGQQHIAGTAWGAYNAVTGFYSNVANLEGEKRVDSLLWGGANKNMSKGLNEAFAFREAV